jgi:hypothetical protein
MIKYPIIVYLSGDNGVVSKVQFDKEPEHHFDSHYIKDNLFIVNTYDIEYEYFLNYEDACAETKELTKNHLKKIRNDIKNLEKQQVSVKKNLSKLT